MARRPAPAQKEVVDRVMHEFKQGELHANGGAVVTNPRQAIAMALRESGSSNQVTPARNRQALRRTTDAETRATLLARARDKNIPGRSRMTKDQLRDAIGKAT